jgi:DUF4097 and DUF4098 domain-containing protein YvlB
MRKGTLLAFLLILAPAVAAAQRDDSEWLDNCRSNRWNNDRDNHCEVRVAGFRLGGKTLNVDARENGGISIHAWDRDSVEVHERIQVSGYSSGEAADIGRQIRVTVNDARIRADGPSTRGRNTSWSVTYDICVPRSVNLELVANNGPIGINGTNGAVNATTMNGPLSLVGLSGQVHARTSNGPLHVSLVGTRWVGGSMDAETTNGPASVDIPEGYAAHLVTGTVNGPMRSDFPITLQGNISARRIETDIGGGGPTVRALTTNGPLVLRRM